MNPTPRILHTLTLIIICAMTAFGDLPPFDSTSDGSDGPLVILTPSEDPAGYFFDPRNPLSFDPDGMNGQAELDVDGDGVYHFTEIVIGEGVVVKLSAIPLNTRPVVWLSQGVVEVHGTLDLDGEAGQDFNGERRPAIAGAGGFDGGIGGSSSFLRQPGCGPGGGRFFNDIDNGPAGHAISGGGPGGGLGYGNRFLMPLLGGSGGAGGMNNNSPEPDGAGGAGGGAILIAGSISITLTGRITANGGEPGSSLQRSPGGGSGGAVRLVSPLIRGSGEISVQGGRLGNPHIDGSYGRIRLEAFEHEFAGSFSPPNAAPSPRAPGILVSPAPSVVRVVSVAGSAVRGDPIGRVDQPDLSINESGEAQIGLEAENIPPGTTVRLKVFSADGSPQEVESDPLVGSFEFSTTSARVRLPPGLSRFSVMATWDPEVGN